MSDTFDTYRDRLTEFQNNMKYVDGATGVAIAVGTQIVSADLFDKPATCSKVWNRLLSGAVLDALEAKTLDEGIGDTEVEHVLATLNELPWQLVDPAGEGQEYRAESDEGTHASALSLDDVLVHGTVVLGNKSSN